MNKPAPRFFPALALLLSAALLLVWPLPGTIALRHLLLLLTAITVAVVLHTSALPPVMRHLRGPLLAVLALSAWLTFQALAFSGETRWALTEIAGQWLPALLALAIGIGLGVAGAARGTCSTTLTVCAGVLLLLVMVGIGQSVQHYAVHGELLRMEVPLTRGHLEMSVIINALLALLLADLLSRADGGSGLLRVGTPLVVAAILCALFEAYLASARNGLAGTAVLIVCSLALLMTIEGARALLVRHRQTAIVVACILIAAGALTVRGDQRWDFLETVPVAWDIEHNRAWMGADRYPFPTLPNGEPVEVSAYQRVAFIRLGGELIAEHPLGVGYGRNAFGHALDAKYGAVDVGHAHSGFIDLGIAAGLPGIALWLVFVVTLLRVGWRGWITRRNGAALALLLLVGEYTFRMLLDSVNRDHMLQTFFFLAGCLSVMASTEPSDSRYG